MLKLNIFQIQKYNLVRVVILDFDVHHGKKLIEIFFTMSHFLIFLGQGSEIIWFGESRVLYISLHRSHLAIELRY